MKFVKNSDKVSEGTGVQNLEYEVRGVLHSWRNRISYRTSKFDNNPENWDFIIDKRVCLFYKPCSQMLNFTTFMLVAHRNMLSVYKM